MQQKFIGLTLRLTRLRRGEVLRGLCRRQHAPLFGFLNRIGELDAVIDPRRIHAEALGRNRRDLENVTAHLAAFGRGQDGHGL